MEKKKRPKGIVKMYDLYWNALEPLVTQEVPSTASKPDYFVFKKNGRKFMRAKIFTDHIKLQLRLYEHSLERYEDQILTEKHVRFPIYEPYTAVIIVRSRQEIEKILPIIVESYRSIYLI